MAHTNEDGCENRILEKKKKILSSGSLVFCFLTDSIHYFEFFFIFFIWLCCWSTHLLINSRHITFLLASTIEFEPYNLILTLQPTKTRLIFRSSLYFMGLVPNGLTTRGVVTSDKDWSLALGLCELFDFCYSCCWFWSIKQLGFMCLLIKVLLFVGWCPL